MEPFYYGVGSRMDVTVKHRKECRTAQKRAYQGNDRLYGKRLFRDQREHHAETSHYESERHVDAGEESR